MAESTGISLKGKASAYRYEAYTSDQELVKGTITATSEIEAGQLLAESGYRPISIKLARPMFALDRLFPTLFAVKPREVILFSRQMATLIESGVSLLAAMELIQGQMAAGKGFKTVLGSMIDGIRTGKSFSSVVADNTTVFSPIYARTIAVGEMMGRLESSLRQLADFMEKRGALNKKLTGALTYPAMVLGIAMIVSFILVTVVLPPLTNMFTSMNISLPITTRMLMALSNFMAAYQVYVLAGMTLLVVLAAWYVKQPGGRQMFDRLFLTAPIIGPAMHMGELGRISRTMAVLLDAGVPLQEIMEMLPDTTSNTIVRSSLVRLYQGLMLGEGLAGPMAKDDLFPPLMVQMVAVGEESNALDSSLRVVAELYETTAEERLNALVGMITPLSTVFIGGVAAFVALSVIMPIYSITGSIG
jgi:type IV pilus assembly protein PilC